jgi:hypothetical protein
MDGYARGRPSKHWIKASFFVVQSIPKMKIPNTLKSSGIHPSPSRLRDGDGEGEGEALGPAEAPLAAALLSGAASGSVRAAVALRLE